MTGLRRMGTRRAVVCLAMLVGTSAGAADPTLGSEDPSLPALENGRPGAAPPGFAPPALDTAAVLRRGLAQQPVAPRLRGAKEVQLFADASPAVFKLVVYDPSGAQTSIGSGVLVSDSGQLLTNLHVVGTARPRVLAAYPKPAAGEPPPKALLATVVRVDPTRDLALVQIEGFQGGPTPLRVSTDPLPSVGADVHAIGHPKNEQWTFTRGMVSQVRRAYLWGEGHMADVVQHQTPIDAGSSGGPLLNDAGELVGLNTFVSRDRLALNYAVAAHELRAFLDALPTVQAAPSTAATESTQPASLAQTTETWTEFDQDGDGQTDRWVGDRSGDGAPDTLYLDDNGDGQPDRAFVDLDGDREFEARGRDEDGNGRMDTWLFDHDLDGTPDARGVDADEDGNFDAVERL